MGLLSRLKQATSRIPFLHSSIGIMDGSGMRGAKARNFNLEVAVRQYNGWLYAGINLRANAWAQATLRLYQRSRTDTELKQLADQGRYPVQWQTRAVEGRRLKHLHGKGITLPSKHVLRKTAQWGTEVREVVEEHPSLVPLMKPNMSHSGYDLTINRALNLFLTGNFYLHHIADKTLNIPTELWCMPSQWVEIIPDRDNYISGYKYGQDTINCKTYPPDEVIHGKLPNPQDPFFYGKGLVQAAWASVGLVNAKADMDLAFIDNMARPDFMVIAKNATGDDANLKRYEQQFNNAFRGARKKGRVWFAGGDISVEQMNTPPEKYGDDDAVLQKLMATIGVPITMVLGNDTTLANSRAGHLSFLRDTVTSDLIRDEEILNQFYLPLFPDSEDYFFAYDCCVPADEAFELKRNATGVALGVVGFNEYRDAYGLGDPDPSDRFAPLGGRGNKSSGRSDGADGATGDNVADAAADSVIP